MLPFTASAKLERVEGSCIQVLRGRLGVAQMDGCRREGPLRYVAVVQAPNHAAHGGGAFPLEEANALLAAVPHEVLKESESPGEKASREVQHYWEACIAGVVVFFQLGVENRLPRVRAATHILWCPLVVGGVHNR